MEELRAREVALARDVDALTERVAMAFGGAPFAVMPIDGKGFGVVATRDLFIGERLLAETPLLVVPMDVSGYDGQRHGEYEGIPSALLEAAVDALPADRRCKFFELSQNSAYGVTRCDRHRADQWHTAYAWLENVRRDLLHGESLQS
jgi:hypothetical protein